MSAAVHLRAGGVSVVLDARGRGLPCVVHWGREVDDADGVIAASAGAVPRAVLDVPVALSLVPERAAGWRGRPGLTGTGTGAAWSPRFTLGGIEASATSAVVEASDPAAGLELRSELELGAGGVTGGGGSANDIPGPR